MASVFGMGLAAGLASSLDTQIQEGQKRAQELADKVRDYHLARAESTREARDKRMTDAKETVRTLNALTGDPNRSALLIKQYRTPELAIQAAEQIDTFTKQAGISKDKYYELDTTNEFAYTENDLAYALGNMDLVPSYEFGTTKLTGESRKDLGVFGVISGFDPEVEGAKSARRIMGAAEQTEEAFRPVEDIEGAVRIDLLPTGQSNKERIEELEQMAIKLAKVDREASRRLTDEANKLRRLDALDEASQQKKRFTAAQAKAARNIIEDTIAANIGLEIQRDEATKDIIWDDTLLREQRIIRHLGTRAAFVADKTFTPINDVVNLINDFAYRDVAFRIADDGEINAMVEAGIPITASDLVIEVEGTTFSEKYDFTPRQGVGDDNGPPKPGTPVDPSSVGLNKEDVAKYESAQEGPAKEQMLAALIRRHAKNNGMSENEAVPIIAAALGINQSVATASLQRGGN